MSLHDSVWIAAFLAGFLGSPHCIGMCGGIITAFGMSIRDQSTASKVRLVSSYHAGRIVSYTLLGILAGLLGTAAINPLRGSPLPMILLGLAFVIVGASMLGLKWLNGLERFGLGLWQKMAPLRQKLLPLHTMPRAFAAGILWGFLPCGLVYGGLLLAFNAGSISNSAFVMFMFGLGTLPMLLLGSSLVQALQTWIGQWQLRRINGVLLILVGIWTATLPMRQHHHAHKMSAQPEITTTTVGSPSSTAVVSVTPATQAVSTHHDMPNMPADAHENESHEKMMQDMANMDMGNMQMSSEAHEKMMQQMQQK